MSTALAPITSQDAPEQLSWRSFRTKPSNRPEPELLTMSIGTSATVGYVDLHSASRVRLLKAATLRDLFGAVGPPPMRGLVSQLIQEHVEGLWAPTQQVVNVLDLLPLNAGSWEPSVTTYTVTVRLNEAARVIGAAFEPLTADRAIEAALEPLRTLHTIEAAFEPLRLVQGGTMPVIGRHRASAALPSAPIAPPTSAAFRAFSELRGWLLLTADEAADLIGVGRTTPNAWARSGFEPRPKTARVLYHSAGSNPEVPRPEMSFSPAIVIALSLRSKRDSGSLDSRPLRKPAR